MINFSKSHNRSIENIILGTAQFGLKYGVANRLGKPDIHIVRDVLDLANELGIRKLDTAVVYGDSETVLGHCGMENWSIITKIPSLCDIDTRLIGAAVKDIVRASMERLGVKKLHAVLAHDQLDAIGERGLRLFDALKDLVCDGQIEKIGVSVYEPSILEKICLDFCEIVQAPANVLDHRFINSGYSEALNTLGGEVHARSLFLQGLLLMPASQRPAMFDKWQSEFVKLENNIKLAGVDAQTYCLGYVMSQSTFTNCVVGVETPNHLNELAVAFRAGLNRSYDVSDLFVDDLDLIDPRNWSKIR